MASSSYVRKQGADPGETSSKAWKDEAKLRLRFEVDDPAPGLINSNRQAGTSWHWIMSEIYPSGRLLRYRMTRS